MHVLLLALQLAVTQPARQTVPSRADSVDLRARVDSAIREFQNEWAEAWIRAQSEHGYLNGDEHWRDENERLVAIHCHRDGTSLWLHERIIRGDTPSQPTCPRFLPLDSSNVRDERFRLDNALDRRDLPTIAARRLLLREQLDTAAHELPHDIYIAQQRVRFALDAGDLNGAANAALTCGYDGAQCGLLQGLILYRFGDIARADSTFAAAADLMTAEQRCTWNDISMLLDRESRDEYERLGCDARAGFEKRFWWLADPLWLEPGNERRAEQAARKVTVSLLAPLGDDGRQHFIPRLGGEAVIESLIRYGWPTEMYWAGPLVDAGHNVWLDYWNIPRADHYILREYTRQDRLHVAPLPATLDNPFSATRDGWYLRAPLDDIMWWPQEFYARDRSALVPLPEGQMEMLRRRDSTRFAWAGDLDSVARGRTVDMHRQVALFDSRAVGDVDRVGYFPLRGGSRVLIDAQLAAGKTLIGIEVSGDSTHAAARTRYATNIEPPLSALSGGQAVSQPLLFDAPADVARSVTADSAIAHMYAGTTLRDAGRVGVYWEGYGFRASDTLDFSVRITRTDRPNAVVRAIRVLGIGDSGQGGVAIRWRELPQNSRAVNQREGDVLVQMRSIVVDVSQLAHGDYELQLSINRPGQVPVTSERAFALR